jgi:hypothetical protein
MFGVGGFHMPTVFAERLGPIYPILNRLGFDFDIGKSFLDPLGMIQLAALLGIVLLFPNTSEIMRRYRPVIGAPQSKRSAVNVSWRMTIAWGAAVGAIALIAVGGLGEINEFLYFNF